MKRRRVRPAAARTAARAAAMLTLMAASTSMVASVASTVGTWAASAIAAVARVRAVQPVVPVVVKVRATVKQAVPVAVKVPVTAKDKRVAPVAVSQVRVAVMLDTRAAARVADTVVQVAPPAVPEPSRSTRCVSPAPASTTGAGEACLQREY